MRMSLGTGTVRHGVDGRAYFIVHGHLVGVDGAPDGEFEGVWAAHVFTPQDLVNYPDHRLRPSTGRSNPAKRAGARHSTPPRPNGPSPTAMDGSRPWPSSVSDPDRE